MQRAERKTTLDRVSLAIFICFVVLAVVGVAAFPYAPIHRAGDLYIDKLGHPHSVQYYSRFRIWERAYIAVGSVVGLLAIGLAIHRYRQTGSFRISPTRPNHAMERTAGSLDS